MSPITTHILDIANGTPAKGVAVRLELRERGNDSQWCALAAGATNEDGRISDLLADDHALKSGVYRITFDTGAYFKSTGTEGFYPEASIVFEIRDPGEHYHVPLILSPYGYSTYRGS